MSRKQFTFYRSFYDAILKLPIRKRYKILMAIVEYALEGILPDDLDSGQSMIFVMAKPNLDASIKKAKAGSIGGKISKRGPAQKISKGEIENENKNEIEIELETESKDEGFPAFWERYPLKVGREAAEAEWLCVSDLNDDILEGLECWISSKQWQRENGRFIPKAEKWLRERWWHQRPEQVIPQGASGKLGKAELESIQRLLKEE